MGMQKNMVFMQKTLFFKIDPILLTNYFKKISNFTI